MVCSQGDGGWDEQQRQGARDSAPTQRPDRSFAVCGQCRPGSFGIGVQDVDVLEQGVRGGGEPHSTALGLQELNPQIAGESLELLGDRRRREVQCLRGGGDRAAFGEHSQGLKPWIDHVISQHGDV